MSEVATIPNGRAAAAIVAAAFGCFVLGVIAFAADAMASLSSVLNIWNPTGPLSGVTGLAIVIWLATWFVLSRLWGRRDLDMKFVNLSAVILVGVGLLLTFPPFMDFLQGK